MNRTKGALNLNLAVNLRGSINFGAIEETSPQLLRPFRSRKPVSVVGFYQSASFARLASKTPLKRLLRRQYCLQRFEVD